MDHFIITKFNDYFPKHRWISPHLGIDEEWLEKRLGLLNDFTIPSIKAQTDRDFTWILKCHPKTPLWARRILDAEDFVVSYEEEIHNSISVQASVSFAKIIRRLTKAKYIITTRLDSDDVISKDHIKLVKEGVQPNKFFDFGRGIVKIKNDYFLHYKSGTSQFCSYMECSDVLLTVYHKIHPVIEDNECIKNRVDLGWMQNHHDSNIGADLKAGRTYPHKVTDWSQLKESYPSLFTKRLPLKVGRPRLFL